MRAPTSRTFPDLMAAQVALMGDGIAVIDRGNEYSYTDLAKRARQLAAGLRTAGLKRGDRIGILMSNRIEWLEMFFGASMEGAVVVPISTWSKRPSLSSS
jgi:acyl-CoA synthetase (AMP-forming)/AMP-acid ligase II